MKHTIQLVMAIAFAAMQWCAMAATIEVDTVAKLVAAAQSAGNGDTIVIKSGVAYTFGDDDYCEIDGSVKNLLNVTAQNVSIVGESDTSREDWTDGAEPVILNVNGKGRLFKFASGGCSVRNVVITGCNVANSTYSYNGIVTSPWSDAAAGKYSAMFTNCVFRGNATTGESYVGIYCALFDCCFTNNSIWVRNRAYGCDFLHNTGKFQYLSDAQGCRFEGNNTGEYMMYNCVTLSNCVFVSNTNSSYMLKNKDKDSALVGCQFSDNSSPVCINAENSANKTNNVTIADCTFTSNRAVVYATSLNGRLSVTNSTFTGNKIDKRVQSLYNEAWNSFCLFVGNGGDRCTIADSKFSSNHCDETDIVNLSIVYGVKAVRCDFSSSAGVHPNFSVDWTRHNDVAYKSILEDCDISAGEIRNCVVDRCTIHDVSNQVYAVFQDCCRVTNSLVKGCSNTGGLYVSAKDKPFDAEFVNCTFVTNTMQTINAKWENTVTNDCNFINCIFSGNRTSATDSDLVLENSDNSKYKWENFVNFTHSYYGKFTAAGKLSASVFAAKTNAVDALSLCVDPKFVKDSRPDAPYWSLLPRSPLCGKGDPLDFTDSDLDLAGRLRLREGKIDPGCYQCWLNPAGFVLVVR